MQHNAEQEQSAFMQLGVGKLVYLKVLDCVDVLALAGVAIAPTEYAVCLTDADGSPHLIRGTIAECLLEAQERGLAVAAF